MALNGQLLSGDTVIAEIEDDNVQPVVHELLPLYLMHGGGFEDWLVSRAVDSSRPNSRILKKMLKLKSVDDVTTVLHSHAATITDNYWFRNSGERLAWDDVRFIENQYADLALTGNYLAFIETTAHTRTPELTNIGSFEKAWKLENGVWYLYKQGNANERFSELVTFKLGKLLGFGMAEYEQADGYIKSRDFTEGLWNFEPASSIVGDSVDEVKIYDAIKRLNPLLVQRYLNITYLDALVFNVDRHSFNYGFFRNPDSGETVMMAPNFDNNLSLISRGAEGSPYNRNTLLINDFVKLLQHADEAFPLPKWLTDEDIRTVTDSTLPDETVDRQFAAELIIDRQHILVERIKQTASQQLDISQ